MNEPFLDNNVCQQEDQQLSDSSLFLAQKNTLKWLEQFVPLPHGIPTTDTFLRVFSVLDIANCVVTIDAMGTQKSIAQL
jgi:hypothetical protein